jgi:hypothetical protein
MAIGQKARAPKISSPPIRLIRMSGAALHSGVKQHKVSGAVLRVFTPAKTVADCFKFRNKIGLEVAIEALKECRRSKKERWMNSGLLPKSAAWPTSCARI